jgi:mono/diheme cytochrome c family protein
MANAKKDDSGFFGQKPLAASIERGKKVYTEQCLSCHMADGLGVSHMNPPLVKTPWVLGDKAKLITVVLKGMTEKTEINGDIYHNVMAAHDFMTDQQIADVLTYIRNSFGNKAKAITPADVKMVRAKSK